MIRRRGRGARGASFDLSLVTLVTERERESLDLARRLLHSAIFQPDASGVPPITQLEAESLRHRAVVSSSLKQAVFQAAEIVARGFIEDYQRRRNEWPAPPPLADLRDNALLVLYRLLFILYAESRDERLQRHALYRRSYSLESLVDRLLPRPPESWARNRSELWHTLLATFRIFDEGLPALAGFENIPPRGGPLFSPDAPAAQWIGRLRLCDADVARLLIALATASPRRGVGRERISYRELAIEQLGSVYEGLLEYEPRIAEQVMFDLRVQGREFVLAPAELVRLVRDKDLQLHGPAELVADPLLAELQVEEGEDDPPSSEDFGAASEEEDEEDDEQEEGDGLKAKARATLLRRLEPGAFYFASGAARKSSGSYYTRDEIVQYLARHALAGRLDEAAPDDILRLRVIDLACGSAHFLVGAARLLGAALHAAYQRVSDDPPREFYPGKLLGDAVRRDWERDAEAWCKRRVVEHCLYGVDLNPTAVQLAQVALWIESLAGDRPLSYFAHHVRCGNSLLGTSLDSLDRPPLPDLPGGTVSGAELYVHPVRQAIRRALDARRLIDQPLPADVRPDTPEEYRYKEDRRRDAEQAVDRARVLFDLRCAAAFVPAIWRDWINLLGETDPEAWSRTRPWWNDFAAVRERERFFHWELEFPEIFHGERKGFDAVLGNPPWEKVKPDRKEFYARADVLIRAYAGGALDAHIRELHKARPELEAEFEAYEDRLKTTAACFVKGGDFVWHEAEIAGRRTGGDPDLFKFILDRAWQVLAVGGRVGYLIPGGIYSSEGCTGLRKLLLERMRVSTFFGFENREKIFDIDSRYKFVCLTAEKLAEDAAPDAAGFTAAFMRHDIEELESGPPAGVQVLIRRDELAELSPGTLAFLEYRSERDREIVLKMYGRGSGRTPRPLLGAGGADGWGVKYSSEFHMTNDRGLWTKPDGGLWSPREVCGLDWPRDPAIPFAEVRAAMAREGFWPLYEGKHIDQWLVDTKPVTRWLSLEAHRRENDDKDPAPGRKLVFRDIARNTDERTAIAAVLPERSCSGHTLSGFELEVQSAARLCDILNSVVFDFITRIRTTGTHLSWTMLSRAPVPTPALAREIPTLGTESAAGTMRWGGGGGKERIARANDSAEYEALWAVERAVAEAYGLDADDFAHILSSFPVMTRKRAPYVAFLRTKMADWR